MTETKTDRLRRRRQNMLGGWITADEMDVVKAAAEIERLTVSALMRRATLEAAERILERQRRSLARRRAVRRIRTAQPAA